MVSDTIFAGHASRLDAVGVALGIALLALAPGCFAKTIEEVVELPVTVTSTKGHAVTRAITVTVFRDDQRKRAPFLVLNHGRPTTSADFAKLGRVRYPVNARYFVSKGFAVFVPTRIGYGVTGGEDVEFTGACSARNYPPGYEAPAQQSIKVIEYARALPYVDANRGLVVGQSWGGTTAIALAAKNLPGVVVAVNFAGGGGGNPVNRPENPCSKERLEELFASYGATSRIPTLWAYSENDRYFGKDLPRAWFNAFRAKGGVGEFVQLPPHGEDGHPSFSTNTSAWRPLFEDFLRRNGFQ